MPDPNHANNDDKPNSFNYIYPFWWVDTFSTAGRKAQNQDSIVLMSCLLHPHPKLTSAPLLVVLADGVSACQFPKQASRIATQTVSEIISSGLQNSLQDGVQDIDINQIAYEDDEIARLIKSAVNKANDAMYFSQAYQRVPPLLSTLSGLLCIGDRIHLFHTGDSRIYRVNQGGVSTLTQDHRIHHGQDKGALSAALGADVCVELQQAVFTLHQNEYLVLMTDGVYEFIDPTEMAYELQTAVLRLDTVANTEKLLSTPALSELSNPANLYEITDWQISQQLCEHALNEGSNDNLSMITLGLNIMESLSVPQKDLNSVRTTNKSTPYQLLTGLEIGDVVDSFEVDAIIARTARSEVYLVHDRDGHQYVLKSPSLATVDDGQYLRQFLKERKIGLSLSKHQRSGELAFNQANPNSVVSTLSTATPTVNTVTKATNKATNKVTKSTLSTPKTAQAENLNNLSSQRQVSGSGLSESGLLRYYPVPASSTYLYHLTEYIEGESLRVFIEHHAPCDVWQTYDLLVKIGMAVRVMHRNYLLHQDIKPENILLTKSGSVKLIDFGSTSSSIVKDNTRPPVGDLHYSAPEYYTDAPKGVHSDLFSIAIIGYELLTGELPFTSQQLMSESSSLVVPKQLLQQNKVPAASQQALIRALHRNTNARHQAIGEFLQDFNPDNMASLPDPQPLIIRNPLLVWHGICFIQFIVIVYLLLK